METLPSPPPSAPIGSGAEHEHKAQWQLRHGFKTPLDLLYDAHPAPRKPRLPTAADRASEWRSVMYPTTTEEFMGNEAAVALLASEKALTTKMEEAGRHADQSVAATFILIKNYESVSATFQQHHLLPLLAALNSKSVFAILLVRPDADALPEQLRQRATKVHLLPPTPMQIGYTRDGLERLLERRGMDLVECISALHQVFLERSYVSLPNVDKVLAASAAAPAPRESQGPPFALSIVEMNTPLRRCKTCTLPPPCAHVTLQHLFERVDRVRQLYPRQDPGIDSSQDCLSKS
ncbi:hypothetical protein ATCC90586_008528 [Pythium insidiosum]|nr:hypothetical protein ATCC90586_008528 [Pythium insidiosum]